jgi:hypothetical protein
MAETQMDQDATAILKVLAEAPRDEHVDRNEVSHLSGLDPERVNDAVALLVDAGLVEWILTFGTVPYVFNSARITSRGRYEYQRLSAGAAEQVGRPTVVVSDPTSSAAIRDDVRPRLPPVPIGSPYGFTDEDWEAASERRSQAGVLYAVLGHQSKSEHFDAEALRFNVKGMLGRCVDAYNGMPGKPPLSLDFRPLSAGYGEHLFNEIARDIIGSDIAVFETSDLNANVMLEMGVALTWGIRVLPIKLEGRPKPPSDVSGQTWADYRDSAATFVDLEHERKLVRMIERAVQKKGPRVV